MVLYGHTHRPVNDWVEGLYVVNPGTAGSGTRNTWARIMIEDGKIEEVSIEEI